MNSGTVRFFSFVGLIYFIPLSALYFFGFHSYVFWPVAFLITCFLALLYFLTGLWPRKLAWRKIQGQEHRGLFQTCKKLADQHDLPPISLHLFELSAPTAFCTSRWKNRYQIFLSTGAYQKLRDQDLENLLRLEFIKLKTGFGFSRFFLASFQLFSFFSFLSKPSKNAGCCILLGLLAFF